jgi:phosphate starvation-inducible PhoH-like protein
LAEVTIPLMSHEEAILVLGPYDRHAKLLRQVLEIEIYTRNGNLRIQGTDDDVAEARRRIEHLLGKLRKGREIDPKDAEAILIGPPSQNSAAPATHTNHGVASSPPARPSHPLQQNGDRARLRDYGERAPVGAARFAQPGGSTHFRVRAFDARGERQRRYLEYIQKRTLVFGLGAAGSGKTFLAVAAALRALRAGECRKLVITRPVVEAGEKLGFLPGDLLAKLDPYMRPVYDALGDLLEFEDIARLEEAGVIEVAPLAYMRGRTLNSAFVILDEAQNTSVPQMKMFLTRLGAGSRMVVTGDPSQTDLERGQRSGLADAVARLQGFNDVGLVEFTTDDIQRHALVAQIVRAYEMPSKLDAPKSKGDGRGEGEA